MCLTISCANIFDVDDHRSRSKTQKKIMIYKMHNAHITNTKPACILEQR